VEVGGGEHVRLAAIQPAGADHLGDPVQAFAVELVQADQQVEQRGVPRDRGGEQQPAGAQHTVRLRECRAAILRLDQVVERTEQQHHVDRAVACLQLPGVPEPRVHAGLALECNESEAARASRVLIHHQGSVNNAAELGKVVLELLVRRILAHTAYEDLARFLLLISGDSTLGVNLPRALVV
jgi:hypothetical protein